MKKCISPYEKYLDPIFLLVVVFMEQVTRVSRKCLNAFRNFRGGTDRQSIDVPVSSRQERVHIYSSIQKQATSNRSISSTQRASPPAAPKSQPSPIIPGSIVSMDTPLRQPLRGGLPRRAFPPLTISPVMVPQVSAPRGQRLQNNPLKDDIVHPPPPATTISIGQSSVVPTPSSILDDAIPDPDIAKQKQRGLKRQYPEALEAPNDLGVKMKTRVARRNLATTRAPVKTTSKSLANKPVKATTIPVDKPSEPGVSALERHVKRVKVDPIVPKDTQDGKRNTTVRGSKRVREAAGLPEEDQTDVSVPKKVRKVSTQ
jgi:hypothetical protein